MTTADMLTPHAMEDVETAICELLLLRVALLDGVVFDTFEVVCMFGERLFPISMLCGESLAEELLDTYLYETK